MKLGKTALDYIDSVCSAIRSERVRTEFREELSDHMEHKVAKLMEEGFSQDCAEWEAAARMGAAAVISGRLNRIHRPHPLVFLKYVCLGITCFLGFSNIYPYFEALLSASHMDGSTSILYDGSGGIVMADTGSAVIGGVDGPTTTYITSRPNTLLLLFLVFAAITLCLFLLPKIRRPNTGLRP
ncbi:permease prefix domain 1-containing protein [Christensenella tenuis]|uniref:Uncharacterized protein n=1 Tax=Christensenella tenuis TaxID=2763033 RepID=A0ABR7EGF6_9FIRM|nr:permease prefix domain 1-containing protein [Christensenella tenuis]MBC5648841.1 hypothetical protein [Christensenella tenuis]